MFLIIASLMNTNCECLLNNAQFRKQTVCKVATKISEKLAYFEKLSFLTKIIWTRLYPWKQYISISHWCTLVFIRFLFIQWEAEESCKLPEIYIECNGNSATLSCNCFLNPDILQLNFVYYKAMESLTLIFSFSS